MNRKMKHALKMAGEFIVYILLMALSFTCTSEYAGWQKTVEFTYSIEFINAFLWILSYIFILVLIMITMYIVIGGAIKLIEDL